MVMGQQPDRGWVLLQGKDAVPESVDHVPVRVDPKEDRTWLQSEPAVATDNAHALDKTGALRLPTLMAWWQGGSPTQVASRHLYRFNKHRDARKASIAL